MKTSRLVLLLCFLTILVMSAQWGTYAEKSFAQPIIKLKCAHTQAPAPAPRGQAYVNWEKKIEEKTNGRVKIADYPVSTLVGVKEQYDSLTSGIADLGQLDLFADPKQFQLTGVVCDIPNVNFPSLKVRNQILLELLEKFPEMKRETKGVKILFIIPYPRNTLHFAKRLEVRKPEDLRGLRIATAPMLFPILDAWRTSPINIPWTDRYLALERGVIDGTFINWGPMSSMRLSEVTKAHTDKLGGLPQASGLVVVNEKVWNGLPPDIQKVFIENNEYGYTEFDRLGLMEEKRGREDCEKAGHLIIDTTPEEFALWSESYRALEDKWILEREAKGLPAKKILEEMKRLINVYSK